MAERSVSIRLGTSGKADVIRALDDIATSGDASAKRLARSYAQAGEDMEAAMRRRAAAEAKLSVMAPGLNPEKLDRFAGVNDNVGKSAQSSASVFEGAYARMEARAHALVAAIDPVYAAQSRFDNEMREAKTLLDAGALSAERYAQVERDAAAALNRVTIAHASAGNASNAQRMAMQGLSYQAQDTFTQLSMGANPLQVIAIQGAQATGQMTALEGRLGSFARFMQTGWGLAITGGLLLLAKLTEGIFDESEADKAAAKAKEEHKRAVEDLINAQNRELQTSERRKALAYAVIELARQEAAATREKTAATLADARAQAEAALAAFNAQSGNSKGGGEVKAALGAQAATAQAQLAAIEAQQRKNDAELARLTAAAGRAEAAYYRERFERRSTPEGQISVEFEKKKNEAFLEAERTKNWAKYQQTINALTAAEAARNKALQDSTAAVKRDADAVTGATLAKFLKANVPGGVRITAITEGKHVAGSDHYKGQAVDFVPLGGMGSMSKDQVRELITSAGMTIRRNRNGVEQLFGPGDPGHANHFHVAVEKGKFALDAFNEATKRAQDAQRELAQILTGLRSAFDPTAAAAAEYRDRLVEIAKLAGLDPKNANFIRGATADQYRVGAKAALLKVTNPEYFAPIKGLEGVVEHDQRRTQFLAGAGPEQEKALAMARAELSVAAANDNVRERTIAKLETILRLKENGVEADSAEGRRYIENEDLLARITDQVRRQRDAWAELRGFGEDAINRLFDPTSGESWGKRIKGVLTDLKAELIKLALLNPLKNLLFGEKNPTLSSIFGMFTGKTAVLPSGDRISLSNGVVPRNAAGTEYFSGGATWLAENGPEIVNLPKGSRVTSAAETRRMLAGNDNGGGVQQHFYLDGAVVDQDLYAKMLAIGDDAAMRGAAGGAQMGEAQMGARRVRRLPTRWG